MPVDIKNPQQEGLDRICRDDLRILLIEDNLVNQKVAATMIQKSGGTIDAVSNGQAALDRLRKEEYHLILMDCQMPVMDGFQTTQHIRRFEEPLCNIPIIAVTAYAYDDDRQRCLEAGMNDFLPKPICRRKLVELVNRHAK